MPHIKPYESPEARLRKIYQIPTPPGNAAALELYLSERGMVMDEHWPAELIVSCRLTPVVSRPWDMAGGRTRPYACEASYREPLPFANNTFDVVILHHTLDELASLFLMRSSLLVAKDWLTQIASIIRPGGLVVGCGLNKTNPRSWILREKRTSTTYSEKFRALGVMSCGKVLTSAGFCDVQVFSLLPNAKDPRSIVSVEAGASKRAFAHELESTRESLDLPGYLARKTLVALSLNRFLEDTFFFWAYKPC